MILNYFNSFLTLNPIRLLLYVAIVVGIAKVCAIQRIQMQGKLFCILPLWSVQKSGQLGAVWVVGVPT